LSLAPRKMMPQLCRVSKQITRLGKERLQAARNLEFERATELRDHLKKLRGSVLISPL
jgi:excinuclease UvrABC helicase subunit UvrB